MKQFIRFVFCTCVFLSITACSIQISQGAPSSQSPSQPVDEAVNIPVTWGNLHLSGRLLYLVADFKGGSSKGGLRVAFRSLDLTTGKVTTIFETDPGGWIRSIAVAPDFQSVIISYSPSADSPLAGKEELYGMPLEGSQPPQLLFKPPTDQDEYNQPEWSPDGKYLYFTRYSSQSSSSFQVMRLAYPDGKLESLVNQAYWPRLSADGTQLTYVSIFTANGSNELFVANADGTDSHTISLLGAGWDHSIIDAPVFLPNGKSMLFSAPIPAQSSAPNWMEKLFGITVAHAHGYIPSDWWSVPLAGGEPVRLTHLYSPGLFASLSPDSKFIASYSSTGIFVMDLQGGDLTQIVNYTGGIPGAVRWIP